MTDIARLAIEIFATADSLHTIAQQIDLLDRDRYPSVCGNEEAILIHCGAPIVAKALETIAQRLAQMED
jgi:hypothetical protein